MEGLGGRVVLVFRLVVRHHHLVVHLDVLVLLHVCERVARVVQGVGAVGV